jgi:hypothetical protein
VVTALDDLERLGFVTRIRRIRRVMTPSGLGLLAIAVFATESNYPTPSGARFPKGVAM